MNFSLGIAGMLSSLFLFFWSTARIPATPSYTFLTFASLFLFLACIVVMWEGVREFRSSRRKRK